MSHVSKVVVMKDQRLRAKRSVKPTPLLIAAGICVVIVAALLINQHRNETAKQAAAQSAVATLKSQQIKSAAAAASKPTNNQQLATYQSQIDSAIKTHQSADVLAGLYENAAFLAASMHNDAAKGYAQKALGLLPSDPTSQAAYAGVYTKLTAFSNGDYSSAQ